MRNTSQNILVKTKITPLGIKFVQYIICDLKPFRKLLAELMRLIIRGNNTGKVVFKVPYFRDLILQGVEIHEICLAVSWPRLKLRAAGRFPLGYICINTTKGNLLSHSSVLVIFFFKRSF